MAESNRQTKGAYEKEEEIKRLFDGYYRPLVLYANEYIHNLEHAKDIVQELFLRLWRKDYIYSVAPASRASYLYRSVQNACKTYLTKKDILHGSVELIGFDIPSDWISAIDDDALAAARNLLGRLPARTREAMEYVIMQEHSYKEAAEKMGISVNTVKFLLKEGLKKARNISPVAAALLRLWLP